jgi:hypothetical protein
VARCVPGRNDEAKICGRRGQTALVRWSARLQSWEASKGRGHRSEMAAARLGIAGKHDTAMLAMVVLLLRNCQRWRHPRAVSPIIVARGGEIDPSEKKDVPNVHRSPHRRSETLVTDRRSRRPGHVPPPDFLRVAPFSPLATFPAGRDVDWPSNRRAYPDAMKQCKMRQRSINPAPGPSSRSFRLV